MKLEAFKAWAVAGPLRVRPQKHAPKCVSLAVGVVSALPPVVKQSTIFKHGHTSHVVMWYTVYCICTVHAANPPHTRPRDQIREAPTTAHPLDIACLHVRMHIKRKHAHDCATGGVRRGWALVAGRMTGVWPVVGGGSGGAGRRLSVGSVALLVEEYIRAAGVLVVRRGVDGQPRHARVVVLDPPVTAALGACVVPAVAARPVVRHDGAQLVHARCRRQGLGGRRLVRRAPGGGGGRVAEAEREVQRHRRAPFVRHTRGRVGLEAGEVEQQPLRRAQQPLPCDGAPVAARAARPLPQLLPQETVE